MAHPAAPKPHDTLADYLKAETVPTGYWANMPAFVVSYLKSMYGDAATLDHEFGVGWHRRLSGDHRERLDAGAPSEDAGKPKC